MRTLAMLLALGCAAMAQAPAANYDEAKVPAYALPPLMTAGDGTPVRTAADWEKRREELRSLLETRMFGRAPGRPDGLTFTLEDRDGAALGGKAVRKQVAINVRGLTFHLLLYLPANAPRPVPVFVSLGFGPNQTVSADPGITLRGTWAQNKETGRVEVQAPQEPSRGSAASRWPVETILGRGFGVAIVYYGDIEPDIAGAMGVGIRGKYLKAGQSVLDADQWGAIAAWAWGLSRALDCLEADPDVDGRRVAVIGHSRLGKTALWAGALDERFALVISNDSGEGGAALARRKFGERTESITGVFPHWFCSRYREYAGREEALPVDQHELLALVAPRPLYVASATEDLWADPRGEFLAARAAEPVYRLLGRPGLGVDEMPAPDRPVGGSIGYHLRRGKHALTAYDWEQYLDFADRHLPGARASR